MTKEFPFFYYWAFYLFQHSLYRPNESFVQHGWQPFGTLTGLTYKFKQQAIPIR